METKCWKRKQYDERLWLEADFQSQLFGFLYVTSKFMMERAALVIYNPLTHSKSVYKVLKKRL